MTREEEIERASVHHLYQYDYSYEEGEHLDFYIKGFTEGAKWADKNPINVWHDASEEPRYEEFLLAEESSEFNVYKLSGQEDNNSWKLLVSTIGIIRWAYIKDLLPKQAGNSKQLKGGKQ